MVSLLFFHIVLGLIPYSAQNPMGLRSYMPSRLLNSDVLELHVSSFYRGEGEAALPNGRYSFDFFIMQSPALLIPLASIDLGKIDDDHAIVQDFILKVPGVDINRALMLAASWSDEMNPFFLVGGLKYIEGIKSEYLLLLNLLSRVGVEYSKIFLPSAMASNVPTFTLTPVLANISDSDIDSENTLERHGSYVLTARKNKAEPFLNRFVETDTAPTKSGFADDDLIVIEPISFTRQDESRLATANDYSLQMSVVSELEKEIISQDQAAVVNLGSIEPTGVKSLLNTKITINGAAINSKLKDNSYSKKSFQIKLLKKNRLFRNSIVDKVEITLGSDQTINLPPKVYALARYGTQIIQMDTGTGKFIFALSRLPNNPLLTDKIILDDGIIAKVLDTLRTATPN